MDFNELSPELQKKVEACKTIEDVVALAKEAGYELSDKELDSISGGKEWYKCSSFSDCIRDSVL